MCRAIDSPCRPLIAAVIPFLINTSREKPNTIQHLQPQSISYLLLVYASIVWLSDCPTKDHPTTIVSVLDPKMGAWALSGGALHPAHANHLRIQGSRCCINTRLPDAGPTDG
jgi:hypothetical protein